MVMVRSASSGRSVGEAGRLGVAENQLLVDLIAEDGQVRFQHHVGQRFQLLPACRRLPVGLLGELSISSLLRGVTAARSWAGVILKPLSSVVGTRTYDAPVICTRSL